VSHGAHSEAYKIEAARAKGAALCPPSAFGYQAPAKRSRELQTIWDVEKSVCEHLNLKIHEIWNDDELQSLSERYAREKGDPRFAALDMELEADDAFGVLYDRNTRNEAGELQYVAFVDCRGHKPHRGFSPGGNEIAYCLTAFEQFEFPFRRVSGQDIDKEQLEKLMDMIAGELGFLDSLFRPVLDDEIAGGKLTFGAVESIRSRFCPDASFQATLNACAARVDSHRQDSCLYELRAEVSHF
jgi:hypothetical protein